MRQKTKQKRTPGIGRFTALCCTTEAVMVNNHTLRCPTCGQCGWVDYRAFELVWVVKRLNHLSTEKLYATRTSYPSRDVPVG